jgi:uncharacterized membrane protein YeaQ/YmgE (transglycosylase-associated protein family)
MFLDITILFLSGLLVGSVAYAIVPGRPRTNILRTAVVGIIGSTVGGIVLRVLVGTSGGLLGGVLGATALVWFSELRREHAAA